MPHACPVRVVRARSCPPIKEPGANLPQVLANTLLANVTASMVWFGLTFWAYLRTRSVLVTSILGGSTCC